jgi:hypothetical protein
VRLLCRCRLPEPEEEVAGGPPPVGVQGARCKRCKANPIIEPARGDKFDKRHKRCAMLLTAAALALSLKAI